MKQDALLEDMTVATKVFVAFLQWCIASENITSTKLKMRTIVKPILKLKTGFSTSYVLNRSMKVFRKFLESHVPYALNSSSRNPQEPERSQKMKRILALQKVERSVARAEEIASSGQSNSGCSSFSVLCWYSSCYSPWFISLILERKKLWNGF